LSYGRDHLWAWARDRKWALGIGAFVIWILAIWLVG
jgi:hypothetical protein